MKKIAIIGNNNRMTLNFRGDLIRQMVTLGNRVIVILPDSDAKEEFIELGVESLIEIPMERTGTSIMGDLKYMFALKRVLKRERPDITFGFTIKPVIYGAIAARLAGVKNINSMITGIGYLFVSDSIRAKAIKMVAKILYRIGLACANHVIFQNTDDVDEFVTSGLVNRKKCYLVNGSGVNMESFKPTKLPDLLTFFMTSRLLYAKGTMEYFNAAQIIKKRYPYVRFFILGAIDDKADCIPFDEVQPFFENGVVKYLGTSNNVSSLMAQSSVFVLPSYREGVPRSVMEAMAMARPILTTDVPGCRETVVDGVNGFLVPAKNIEALVEKMEWFIRNVNKIEAMGKKSYLICKKKFEISIINKKMLSIMNMI